jgi:hypothetical protein
MVFPVGPEGPEGSHSVPRRSPMPNSNVSTSPAGWSQGDSPGAECEAFSGVSPLVTTKFVVW